MDNAIRRSAAPLSEALVAEFEARLGFELPGEYRAFLLQHNGGVPKRISFAYSNAKGQPFEGWLFHFFPLGAPG